MAGEEIPEAGAAEKIEIEDTISPVSKGKKAPPFEVIICDACGKGFLTWIMGGVDNDPIWQSGFLDDPERIEGGMCGGALRIIRYVKAIEIADRYEKIGGEEWLRGKRQP